MGLEDPDRTKVASPDPLEGTVLDRRYRIDLRLAAGGFGAIYRARHVITGREVALKVLHANLTTEPDVVARFRREGAALGQLRNRHTITAYDFGQTSDGTLYIVMELLKGESLWERFCALGPLPWRKLATIARQVCDALAEAHALGIVHRDLKPTNIHLEEVGGDPDFVKVLDFGIAKILHGSALESADLTRTGTVVGTFDYMAPEQMVAAETTGHSDIYTLGIVMYEMLTGERPFGHHETPAAMLTAMLSRIPTPASSFIDAPPELDSVIARCLDKDPNDRYQDALELADDLDGVLALRDDSKTQVAVQPPRMTGELMAEDSLTWVNTAPQLPATTPPEPIPMPLTSNPLSTIPGVAPPARNTPWPLIDPHGKKR